MPTTVKAAFAELLTRIELNPARVELASKRYNAVKSAIESKLPGKVVRQIGSFQRKTKIRPIDLGDGLDIDAVVSFGTATTYAAPGEEGTTPTRALQIVHSALSSNEVYKVMEPTTDAPVVILEYADKQSFKIEIAAAFIDKMGQHSHGPTGPDVYLVGGSDGSWHPSDYDFDAAAITGLNQQPFVRERLVPFIKITKAYLRGRNIPLKSFHIEVLVARTIPPLLHQWQTSNFSCGYHHMLAGFLTVAQSLLSNPVSIPGSFSEPISSNINMASVSEWMVAQAARAWELCKIVDEREAVEAWRAFFGQPFPSVS